jgi:hypothetical protein
MMYGYDVNDWTINEQNYTLPCMYLTLLLMATRLMATECNKSLSSVWERRRYILGVREITPSKYEFINMPNAYPSEDTPVPLGGCGSLVRSSAVSYCLRNVAG